MIFKTPRIEKEFDVLKQNNPLLHDLIIEVNEFSKNMFNKELVLTCILRTKEEQIALYGYARASTHLYYRAVDLRSWIYNEDEIEMLLEFINKKWIYDVKRPNKKAAICHSIKTSVRHFHIQTHPNTKMKRLS